MTTIDRAMMEKALATVQEVLYDNENMDVPKWLASVGIEEDDYWSFIQERADAGAAWMGKIMMGSVGPVDLNSLVFSVYASGVAFGWFLRGEALAQGLRDEGER